MRFLLAYFLVATVLLLVISGALPTSAAISSCTATVSPTTVTTNASTSFTFTIENTDSVDVVWIKITRPSSNFTFSGGSVSGWSMATEDETITLTSGTLSAGGTQEVTATVQTRTGTAASADWTVQVSDDSGGADPFGCTGTLGTAIEGEGADTFAPVISNIAVSSITETSVKVTWTTDESASSDIDYGTTTSYGSATTDSTLVTAHSVTITGLTANTTYHYLIKSTDASSNEASGTDSTFVTAQASGDTGAPSISNVSVSGVNASSATVTWTTDEAADSVVDYGTSTSYGSTTSGSSLVTSHNLELTGLSANTTYHYRVTSTDGSGNTGESGDGNFTTSKADTASPNISGAKASSISSSGAIITWTTDETADSTVEYGKTADYGLSQGSPTQETAHSVAISGLNAKTTYHFRVKSIDGDGNATTSADGTFTTTSAPATPTLPPAPVLPPSDRRPPTASLTTDISSFFATAPTIEGLATDNKGVKGVEYSIDDGVSWLPVGNLETPDATETTFSFTPLNLFDGNYTIRLRVTDTNDNVGLSEPYTLVIDRLPPQVGASLFAIGPQLLSPSSEGIVFALAGLDQQITVSAIGGPTTIDITARVLTQASDTAVGRRGPEQMYSMTKNPNTGLWSGTLSFAEGGVYQLIARALDGAGNTTERTLNSVVALPSGKVVHGDSEVAGSTVALYYLEPTQQRFVLWDGSSFGQQNPQTTDVNGSYQLLVPPGTYYLEIVASGFAVNQSDIFTITQTVPLNPRVVLTGASGFTLGPWKLSLPRLFRPTFGITLDAPIIPDEAKRDTEALVGTELPFFALPHENELVYNTSLRGKPNVLTILNSWSPETSAQLSVLNDLAGNQQLAVTVIMSQETPSRVRVVQQQGHYDNLLMVADRDGELVEALQLHSVPTHVVIDRQGVIKRVVVGVLSKEELLDTIR